MKEKTRTLSAPVRVYWALAPEGAGGIGGRLAVRTAGELCLLRVFFVTLRLSGGYRPDLSDILGALKPAVRVIVSVADVRAFPDAYALSAADGLDLMPADASGLRELLGLAAGVPGVSPSVSIVPAKDNLGFVDEALAESISAGINVFNLPNPDVTRPGAVPGRFVLDGQARSGLKEIIERRLGPLGRSATLNVHDLFLHRELNLQALGGRVEYAGCQAAQALAFIDRSGVVYPCSTWPEPLGRLSESSFADIWAGGARRERAKAARTLPDECVECPDAPQCKGGCIGLALALGKKGGRDPGCAR